MAANNAVRDAATGPAGAAPRPVGSVRKLFGNLGVGGTIGIAYLVLLVLVAIFANVLAPYNAVQQVGDSLEPPTAAHWMGTDLYSRDILSRIIFGARVSLGVGVSVTVAVFVLGLVLGMLAAYFGSWVDVLIGRFTDVLMAVPGILLAIALLAVLGSGLNNVIIAITLTHLPPMIRVVRGSALAARGRLHVRSAVALGASPIRIIVAHIAPYVMGPAVVQATFVFAGAILSESVLSFLGLGIRPPNPTWGNLVSDGLSYLTTNPLLVIFPSIVITSAVLAVNLFGDALRDLVDPEGNVER